MGITIYLVQKSSQLARYLVYIMKVASSYFIVNVLSCVIDCVSIRSTKAVCVL